MAETPVNMKCVVVGAGPVGALAALYAAKRGWDVQVFDLRGDLRDPTTTPLNFTRSINLALSERGINALRESGSSELLDAILADTIPMYGRMLHGQDSAGALSETAQLYDVHGRHLRAVDRGNLNKSLLDALAGLPNVQLNFFHKLTGADFKRRKAWFERRTADNQRIDEIEVDFDLVLGCDGAHSRVRYHLMKFVRMSFSQEYIDTLWCEFTIPPTSSPHNVSATPSAKDGFATSPNHLHIWPSNDMMFIAIPSIDKSFTCTLFASQATFSALEQDPSSVELFFNKHFPGAVDLIGPTQLRSQFEANPHLPLISVKCDPHHYSSTGVILGDAAHAMVPFYGQGMNAGLEDVRVLFTFLDASTAGPASPSSSSSSSRAAALAAYSHARVPDAHAINDLALENYWDMRDGSRSPAHLLRKHVEEFLAARLPVAGFATQYARVSFTNQPYARVVAAVQHQGRVLAVAALGSALTPLLAAAAWAVWRWRVGLRHAERAVPAGFAGVGFGALWERADGLLHWMTGGRW